MIQTVSISITIVELVPKKLKVESSQQYWTNQHYKQITSIIRQSNCSSTPFKFYCQRILNFLALASIEAT